MMKTLRSLASVALLALSGLAAHATSVQTTDTIRLERPMPDGSTQYPKASISDILNPGYLGVLATNATSASNAGTTALTNLSFTVLLGHTYRVHLVLLYSSAGTGSAFMLGASGPTATNVGGIGTVQYAASTTVASAYKSVTLQSVYNAPQSSGTAAAASSTTYAVTVDGFVTPSAAGTFAFTFGSSDNTTVITVLAGSYASVSPIN